MSNEEYVRSVWEKVTESEYDPHEGYTISQTRVDFGPHHRTEIKTVDAWASSSEFTRERLEQVRQVRSQIEWAKAFIFDVTTDYPNGCVFLEHGDTTTLRDLAQHMEGTASRAREDATGLMLVGRLEAELAKLTQGIRPEALQ